MAISVFFWVAFTALTVSFLRLALSSQSTFKDSDRTVRYYQYHTGECQMPSDVARVPVVAC